MKKQIITLIALFSVFSTMAQSNNFFILKEYDSDSWDTITQTGIIREIDINNDGNYDFKYYADINWEEMLYPKLFARNWACFHRLADNWNHIPNTFVDFNIPFNDTTLIWKPSIFPERAWAYYHRYDTIPFKSGIREGVEGEYYYGWIEVYAVNTYDTVYFHVARTCYCTIPNYPLKWGQTGLTIVGEQEGSISLFVYPNPTLGLVKVLGSNLNRIDIYNAIGQRIITQRVIVDPITIDFSGQPSGLYFISATDQNGQRCVRKVVKQ